MTHLTRKALFDAAPMILDGGLATELESRGHDLSDELWSARLLRDNPAAVAAVHRDWLAAGSDCIVSASYQASVPGFVQAGLSAPEATRLIRLSVQLAKQTVVEATAAGLCEPGKLVAAGVGPYGAFLADGSEYHGDYGIGRDRLRAFHEPRWQTLCSERPDLMACETIPSIDEIHVLTELATQTPEVPAWISLSCRDGATLCDGTRLEECIQVAATCPSIIAIGMNCTPPRFASEIIGRIVQAAPDVPVVVYPNSGESWDAAARAWTGDSDIDNFAAMAAQWRTAGAKLIGGCCRTTVHHISSLKRTLTTPSVSDI